MKYVVSTTLLFNKHYDRTIENHNGKFADGNAEWKRIGSTDFVVSGADRPTTALAFVHALCSKFYEGSEMSHKEYPSAVVPYDDWLAELPQDSDPQASEERDFILRLARHVHVNDEEFPAPGYSSGTFSAPIHF